MIGLLSHPVGTSTDERRRARIAFCLHATRAGYAPIDTFELDGNPIGDEVAKMRLESAAERTVARSLLVCGPVDLHWVQALAQRGSLRLINVPSPQLLGTA